MGYWDIGSTVIALAKFEINLKICVEITGCLARIVVFRQLIISMIVLIDPGIQCHRIYSTIKVQCVLLMFVYLVTFICIHFQIGFNLDSDYGFLPFS